MRIPGSDAAMSGAALIHLTSCQECQAQFSHEDLFGEPVPVDRTAED